jgi:hypothetical protein
MSSLYDPDFLNGTIYQGVWQRYHSPAYSSRVLTLSSHNALFILAFLSIAVQYAGSRTWVIVRHLIYHSLRNRGALSVELPSADSTASSGSAGPAAHNDPNLERLLHLSRGRAMMNTFLGSNKLFGGRFEYGSARPHRLLADSSFSMIQDNLRSLASVPLSAH